MKPAATASHSGFPGNLIALVSARAGFQARKVHFDAHFPWLPAAAEFHLIGSQGPMVTYRSSFEVNEHSGIGRKYSWN